MIRRSTWVLVIIFSAALGAVIYLNKYPTLLTKSDPSPTAERMLIHGISGELLSQISVSKGNSILYVIKRNQDQSWGFITDGAGTLDQGNVSEMITILSSLKVVSSLDSVPPKESTGLDENAIKFTLTGNDGQHIVKIGRTTPTQSGYYVQFDELYPYVIDKAALESLLKFINSGGLTKITPPAELLQSPPSTQ